MTYRDVLRCELARRDFWEYCKLLAPDFYKEDRKFLKDKCREYQDFYESQDEYLIDNEPPRHGKSRTATLFVQWVIGKCPKDKIITGSYNETLSTVFSKGVRNKIQETSADGRIVYNDIFPHVKVKRGDGAANLWGIEGNDTNTYLATSPTGTATGFGAGRDGSGPVLYAVRMWNLRKHLAQVIGNTAHTAAQKWTETWKTTDRRR